MASSMTALKIHEDPLLEQKEQIIRDLEDENLSLRQELESLRVGFPEGRIPLFVLFWDYLPQTHTPIFFHLLFQTSVNWVLEPKTPLQERKNRYNAPGSIRSVSKKSLSRPILIADG